MRPSVPLLLASMVSAGTSLGSTTKATILHGSGKFNLAGGSFDLGGTLRIELAGTWLTSSTTTGSLNFDVLIGGTSVLPSSTVMAITQAANTLTTSSSMAGFMATLDLTAIDISTAGGFRTAGMINGAAIYGSTVLATGGMNRLVPLNGPTTGANTIDMTALGAFDVQGILAVANANVQVTHMKAWLLN
jgi:hypothetical protein